MSKAHVPSRPADVPQETWNLTRALQIEGLTKADVVSYIENGRLPDALSENGDATKNAPDRLARLEHMALNGSWTAVNALSFLVEAKRAHMAEACDLLRAQQAKLPLGDDAHSQIEAAITEARAVRAGLGQNLQRLYRVATLAREGGSKSAADKALTLEERARNTQDPGKADKLRAAARKLRDTAAKAAIQEAEYRGRAPGVHVNAARAFQLAAELQIGRGHAEIEAMARSGKLTQEPPACLLDDDGTHTGNGVPGAERLLHAARDVAPKMRDDDRQRRLEGTRFATVAAFHRVHLESGGYFARVADGADAPKRTSVLLGHRQDHIVALKGQAEAARARYELHSVTPASASPDKAVQAAEAGHEYDDVLAELEAPLARALVSERAANLADENVNHAREGQRAAIQNEEYAKQTQANANEQAVDARRAGRSVLGSVGKSGTQAKRDHAAAANATDLAQTAGRQVDVATQLRTEAQQVVAGNEQRSAQSRAQAELDQQDAALVSAAVPMPSIAEGYRELRRMRDGVALQTERALQAGERGLARNHDKSLYSVRFAGERLRLASYWVHSTDTDERVFDQQDDTMVAVRLVNANALLDTADNTRGKLPQGSPARLALANASIGVGATLATVAAGWRPGLACDRLRKAEVVANTELQTDAPIQLRARATVGVAAVASLSHHDARFVEVANAGAHDPRADDVLYAQAHRLLDDETLVSDSAVAQAREHLRALDRSLDAVPEILETAALQLERGQRFAEAQVREIGRLRIAAEQDKVDSYAHMVARAYRNDSELKAQFVEQATNELIADFGNTQHKYVGGAMQLAQAYGNAAGHRLEFLGSLRLAAHTMPDKWDTEGCDFINRHLGASSRNGGDWTAFTRLALGRLSQVPAATAASGSFFAIGSALASWQHRSAGVVTGDMQSMIAVAQGRLEGSQENLGLINTAQVVFDTAEGVLLTAGIAPLLQATRAAAVATTEVGGVAQGAGVAARTVLWANAARAAHPVLYTAGISAGTGLVMTAVDLGVRELFGRTSFVAEAIRPLTALVPVLAAHRAAGVAAMLERAAAGRLAASAPAAATLVTSFSTSARVIAPRLVLACAQAAATVNVVPVIAKALDVRSEVAQAGIAIGVGTLLSTGLAYTVSRATTAGVRTAVRSEHLVALGINSSRARTLANAALTAFLNRTTVPTPQDVAALRVRLYELAGVTREDHGGYRAAIDVTVAKSRVHVVRELALSAAQQERQISPEAPRPKVSVIVPIYKVDKYLRQCLDSIVAQDMEDIEIICVNDHSPDGSLAIAREYARKDPRITVVDHQANLGLGASRNTAMQIARGDYITFVDSDDWVTPNMVGKLYASAKSTGADLVKCASDEFNDSTQTLGHNDWLDLHQFDKRFDGRAFPPSEAGDFLFHIPNTAWGTLLSAKMLRETGALFPDGLMFEDNPFFFKTWFGSGTTALVRDPLIHYRTNRVDSLTGERGMGYADRIPIARQVMDTLKQTGQWQKQRIAFYSDHLIKQHLLWYTKIKPENKEQYYQLIRKDILAYRLTDDDVAALPADKRAQYQSLVEAESSATFDNLVKTRDAVPF